MDILWIYTVIFEDLLSTLSTGRSTQNTFSDQNALPNTLLSLYYLIACSIDRLFVYWIFYFLLFTLWITGVAWMGWGFFLFLKKRDIHEIGYWSQAYNCSVSSDQLGLLSRRFQNSLKDAVVSASRVTPSENNAEAQMLADMYRYWHLCDIFFIRCDVLLNSLSPNFIKYERLDFLKILLLLAIKKYHTNTMPVRAYVEIIEKPCWNYTNSVLYILIKYSWHINLTTFFWIDRVTLGKQWR